jgi:predicted amidohydrolase
MNYTQASEPVPGPTTSFLGRLAKKHGMYIAAGLLERDGDTVYNTAVLMDRNGELFGKYRKVCLPREEIQGGVTPGESLPVFDTDFGRIGLMICWDVFFPEPARLLALQGAEVILMPIWGGIFDLAQARAIENQVYLVTSTYDTRNMKTGVFGREGQMLVTGSDSAQVVTVDVDLRERKLWPWLGDVRNRIPRELPDNDVISNYYRWYEK